MATYKVRKYPAVADSPGRVLEEGLAVGQEGRLWGAVEVEIVTCIQEGVPEDKERSMTFPRNDEDRPDKNRADCRDRPSHLPPEEEEPQRTMISEFEMVEKV